MSTNTGVEWARHSFSTWEGCSPKSRACRFCYARRDSKRWNTTDLWLRKGPRKFRSDEYWRQPVTWNRAAEREGEPARVFCAPMADVFEIHPVAEINTQMDAARARLWRLTLETPWLIWLVLTKRPENVLELTPWGDGDWPANVWIGTSVELQRFAVERIEILLDIPAAKRFLSCEPLLGPLALRPHNDFSDRGHGRRWIGTADDDADCPRIDWVIAGGESGPKADPMHPEWARSLRDQCLAARVPFFLKQWGQWGPVTPESWSTRPVRWRDERTMLLGPDGTRYSPAQANELDDPRVVPLYRVGKKRAGQVLDGQLWEQVPEVTLP